MQRRLQLDPVMLEAPAGTPLFHLASQACAVVRLVADHPMQDFKSGWYLFDAAFVPGGADATQLVVDYGEGFAWLERLSPRYPDASGILRSVVAIKREPRNFGLLAGRHGDVPALQHAGLRAIGRPRALLEMLLGLHACAPRHRLGLMGAAAWSFLRTLLRDGRKAAASGLVERYEATSRCLVNDYPAWLAANARSHRDGEPATPLPPLAMQLRFSLLMNIDSNDASHVRRTLQSVVSQTWPGWQLCIAHGHDIAPGLLADLRMQAAVDPRILLVPSEVDVPSNQWLAALAAANGSYCARLECGDLLAPCALEALADGLVQRPSVGFLYSDHDAIDDAGQRCDPSFKQDWSPDLACRRDAMLYLAMIDRAVLLEMGSHAGSDPYDVVLRACDACGPERILHVPRVLYHRAKQGERSADDEAGLVALRAHLVRCGQDGRASLVDQGVYRVAYPLPDPAPMVEVLLPTRDQRELLARCMDGVLERTSYPNLRVRIIDNDSRDPGTLELLGQLAKSSRVTLGHAPGPFNFSRLINQAASESDAQVLCLLNDDVLVLEPGWLDEMVSQALRPGIGAVGAMLRFPDGSVQHAGVVTGVGGVAGHVHYRLPREAIAACPQLATVRNYTAVTAACMVVTRAKFLQVGGFDEGLPVCYNDVDFCLRLREQGYFNVWTPFAVLAHHESATRGPDDTPLKRARHQQEFARMLARWGDRLTRDPAYNPNLSLYGEPFELAHAPRACNDLRPAYPVQPTQLPLLHSLQETGGRTDNPV